jgi:hypothetical protein
MPARGITRIGNACSTPNTTLPFTDSLASRFGETAVTFNISSKLAVMAQILSARRHYIYPQFCVFANKTSNMMRKCSPGLTRSNVRLLSAITAAHVIACCRNAMPSESESHNRKGPFKTLESKIQQLRRAVAG